MLDFDKMMIYRRDAQAPELLFHLSHYSFERYSPVFRHPPWSQKNKACTRNERVPGLDRATLTSTTCLEKVISLGSKAKHSSDILPSQDPLVFFFSDMIKGFWAYVDWLVALAVRLTDTERV